MVDTENLRTTSLYINNQLLSRGLLRDGQTIDFANAGTGNECSAATAGRIISVVNDLILRRDRDAEHRESLATAMRNLRAENTKHATDITRLSDKNAEERRRADIASAAEAALKTQLKSADATVRGLKEDIARTKTLVAQNRTACATEIRRRDRQIDALKKQLTEAGRWRGSRANPTATTINVMADIGLDDDAPPQAGSTDAGDCDLRGETNGFLTNLAQRLSEENETVLGVMQRAMGELREMSGYQAEERQDAQVVRWPSCEELAAQLDAVLDHMRKILTNPSFVPIEEVMVREDEISRLKSGWVKMESRWREAVRLMDGWRKRMAASGRPVCDEELKMGLRLSPVRVNEVEETREAPGMGLPAVAEEEEEEEAIQASQRSPCPPGHESLDLVPEPEHDDAAADESMGNEDSVHSETHGTEAVAEPPPYQPSPDSSPLPEPPLPSPLRNSASAGNRGSPGARPRPGNCTATAEKTRTLAAGAKSMRSLPVRSKAVAAQTRLSGRARPPPPPRSSLDDVPLARPEPPAGTRAAVGEPGQQQDEPPPSEDGADDAGSRHGLSPRPWPPRASQPAPQQSPLTMSTIAAKLAASEREADAARVRAKLRAARTGVRRPPPAPAPPVEDVDPVKHDPAPPKRKRERRPAKAASRRRSTLSPWELETLMAGSAA